MTEPAGTVVTVAVHDHAVDCAWQDGVSNCDCNYETVREQNPFCYGNGCPATRTCAACKHPGSLK